jgi:glycolate oxidase FAD binding subunit
MARLNEITKAERLWLPIDVPNPETATLGGSMAANVSGPRRYGYGTFRDYVIGVTLVNDRGEETKAGGRVVKNVAGYDLMKLYTGSLGTLGVVTQVTLKLKPMPERWASWGGICARDRLPAVLDQLHRTATRPVMVGFIRGGHNPASFDEFWGVSVVFEGGADAVNWQADCIRREFSGERLRVEDGAHGDGSMPGVLGGTFAGLVFRIGLRPSAAAAFAERAATIPGLHLNADAAGAVIRGYMYEVTPLETARDLIARMMDWSKESGGNLVIKRCPADWKKSLPVWGRPPADLALQKAVKHALDPNAIFNPGRFVTDAF